MNSLKIDQNLKPKCSRCGKALIEGQHDCSIPKTLLRKTKDVFELMNMGEGYRLARGFNEIKGVQ